MSKNYDFSDINNLKKKLDQLRPLEAILYNKIMQKLHLDWTYNSNAIEGNTLTFSETQFYLNFGLTSKGHTLSEYLEIKNHQTALQYLEKIVKEKIPLTERIIKDFHAMLFERNESYKIENEQGQKITVPILPGAYKKQNNYVLLSNGKEKWYCDPLKVIDEMQFLIKFYQKNKENIHPILLASQIHAKFVNIHPFVDGNGRTARLIMNLILMQTGFPPAIIQNATKQDYYLALQKYDDTKEIDDFVAIIEKEVIRTTQIMLNAAEGKAIFEKEDISKRLNNFSKKVSQEEKKENIKKLRDYLYKIAKEKIEGFKNKAFKFEIEYPIKFENTSNQKTLLKIISNKHVYLDLKYEKCFSNSVSLPLQEPKLKDYLNNENDGSCFVIKLSSKRRFIPTSLCYFCILPTKFTLCISYNIIITELDEDNEILSESKNKQATNFIQNGILFKDWNVQDLDNFFNEIFNQFLQMIEHEAELRRIRIEEQKEP